MATTRAQGLEEIKLKGDNCGFCHEVIHENWEVSDHGTAFSDIEFLNAWDGEDNTCLSCHNTNTNIETGEYEYEGVYCLNCHSDHEEDHPDTLMNTDVSSRNCGECHVETFSDWEISEHSDVSLNCNNCHNPHTTTLRVENSELLCISCHKNLDHQLNVDSHFVAGVTCIDCHLSVLDQPKGEGHSQRKHTFEVELNSCQNCHSEGNHNAITISDMNNILTAGLSLDKAQTQVAASPDPVGTWQYIVVSLMAGIVAGVILAPSIEKIIKKKNGR